MARLITPEDYYLFQPRRSTNTLYVSNLKGNKRKALSLSFAFPAEGVAITHVRSHFYAAGGRNGSLSYFHNFRAVNPDGKVSELPALP